MDPSWKDGHRTLTMVSRTHLICHCSTLLLMFACLAVEIRGQSSNYLLFSTDTYYILSGDIEVRYKVPATAPSLQIQLVVLKDQKRSPLAKMSIPANTTAGIVIFPCGLVMDAEKTAFMLIAVDEGIVLAQSKAIDVKWPAVSIHVPLVVETYSSDVIVHLSLASVSCKLRTRRQYDTYVELIYDGPTLSPTGTGKSVWQKPTLIFSRKLEEWLLDATYDVTLNCEYFDKAGYYKVRIRTSTNSTALIAESDTIHVIWSHRYSVSVTKSSVEPCDESLKIIYHYPRCASDRDRVRVYGKSMTGISKPLKYIFESRVHSGKHFTKLSCDLFGEDLQEYCFSFVSTAKNGAVFELDMQCIPRLAQSDGFVPSWHDWGPWSECSSTCGRGVHMRYRLCSTSKLNLSCTGKSVQTEICNRQDCPESTLVPSETFMDLPPECLCGCQLNFTTQMLLKIDFQNCSLPTHWIFQTWPSGEISITLLELVLPATLNALLIIREGISSLGSVLGIYSQTNGSQVLHSSSSAVRIEVYSMGNASTETATMQILITSSEDPKESLAIVQTSHDLSKYTLSTVHITIILLASIFCISAIFFVLMLYFRNAKQARIPTGSPSICSLSQGDGSLNTKLLVASTSTSELSDSSLLEQKSPQCRSSPSKSPEDYLYNSFLFRSLNSICAVNSSASTTPAPRRMHFNSRVEIPQSPMSCLSKSTNENQSKEFDATKKPLKSAMKQKTHVSATQSYSCSDSSSPVRRRGKPLSKATRQIQRDSTTPLTASVSELSITGSEDGFEYDYYDYGCHDEPGSFFCPDPILVGWPPFIPIPPESIDDICDLPLKHFSPSPTQKEKDEESIKS